MFLKTDGAGNLSFNSDLPTTSFTGATVETSIADSDLVLIYDDSATAVRKMTKANLTAGLGGKVLQVVSATTTTNTATSSTTFVTTALSASITPSSASNKILIQTLGGSFYNVTAGYGCISTIFRNSTELSGSAYGIANVWSATARIQVPAVIGIYDSPSTTSSVTYSLRIKSENASGTASHIPNADLATIILMEIAG